jgi:hypothetical protein
VLKSKTKEYVQKNQNLKKQGFQIRIEEDPEFDNPVDPQRKPVFGGSAFSKIPATEDRVFSRRACSGPGVQQ